jgi:hypothetical protein
MLRQLFFTTILFFCAFFTQSLTVPYNNTQGRNENAGSSLKHSENTRIVNNHSATKESSLKDNQPISKIKKNKVPLFVKLGLIFLGVGLVILVATFWGWVFSAGIETSPSWIPLALQTGLGSVAAGLVFLIISWLAS